MTIDPTMGPAFAGLPEKAQLRKAALELESVLVRQLFATMRQSVPKGGLIEESPASEMFRSMLDDEMARITAEKSPFGLADAIVQRFEQALAGTSADPKSPPAIKPGLAPTEAPKEGAPGVARFRRIA